MDTSNRLPSDREQVFPNLFSEGYGVTSNEDELYNCIAWAAGEENQDQFWTPFDMGHGYYWPPELKRDARISTFIRLYEIRGGYQPCDDAGLETGFEKIAIYAGSDGEVTHAARQTEDGNWTSKLGSWEDISHKSLAGLEGDCYGKVVQILKRQIKR